MVRVVVIRSFGDVVEVLEDIMGTIPMGVVDADPKRPADPPLLPVDEPKENGDFDDDDEDDGDDDGDNDFEDDDEE